MRTAVLYCTFDGELEALLRGPLALGDPAAVLAPVLLLDPADDNLQSVARSSPHGVDHRRPATGGGAGRGAKLEP